MCVRVCERVCACEGVFMCVCACVCVRVCACLFQDVHLSIEVAILWTMYTYTTVIFCSVWCLLV